MKQSAVLVVGGAGYIGSTMCKALALKGYLPVTFDNLSTGYRQAVQWGPLITASMADRNELIRAFGEYEIEAVMLFAGFIQVGESVSEPLKYYRNNVAAPLTLVETMREVGVDKLIFSSSCAVYGDPVETPITESHPFNPISPYGKSKLMVESILADAEAAYGLRSISLRYFNAAGADPEGRVGEAHQPETHLIPLAIRAALGQRSEIQIFGDDYPTKDGTCVRDYIHIEDLADAHIAALERLHAGTGSRAYNLGNGSGHTVAEVIDSVGQIAGRPVPASIVSRRPGDAAVLVGSSAKAEQELGWKPKYTEIDDIIETAWQWHSRHPEGYDDFA